MPSITSFGSIPTSINSGRFSIYLILHQCFVYRLQISLTEEIHLIILDQASSTNLGGENTQTQRLWACHQQSTFHHVYSGNALNRENLLSKSDLIASRLALKSSPTAKLTVGFKGANNSCELCNTALASAAFSGSGIV